MPLANDHRPSTTKTAVDRAGAATRLQGAGNDGVGGAVDLARLPLARMPPQTVGGAERQIPRHRGGRRAREAGFRGLEEAPDHERRECAEATQLLRKV